MANFYATYPFVGTTSSGGSVTSVGLADGSTTPIYSITGSPVTTAGTLTLTLTSESANSVFAGPSSGGPAQPTFRALTLADLPSGLGTVTSVGLSAPALFTVSGSPVTTSGTLALSYSGTALPIANGGTGQTSFSSGALSSNGTSLTSGTLSVANGGTGVTSVTTSPNATSFAGWDGNKNFSSNNFIDGYTTTATAAGTTALSVTSTQQQYFTGSSTQTVTLPSALTLVLGMSYYIVNNSTGNVTVKNNGGTTLTTLSGGQRAIFEVTNVGTASGTWDTWAPTVLALAAFGSSANANGASLSGNTLTLQPASSSEPGGVTTGTQTFAGAKTFSSNITLQGTNNLVGTITSGTWNGSVIPVAYGGSNNTNLTTNPAYGVLYMGAGSTTFQSTSSAGQSGQPLLSNGSAGAPSYGAINMNNAPGNALNGTLPFAAGGTGIATANVGDMTYYNGNTTNLATIPIGTAGQVLTVNSGATAPQWSTPAASPTGKYANAFHTTAATWSTTSTSFADPTASGTPVLTVRQSSGITLTTAASSLPGITFTPSSSSAVYLITARPSINNSTSQGQIAVQLTDGTAVVGQTFYRNASSGTVYQTPAITGIYAPATTSPVTLKIQMTITSGGGGGTASIDNNGDSNSHPIEWTILQIV